MYNNYFMTCLMMNILELLHCSTLEIVNKNLALGVYTLSTLLLNITSGRSEKKSQTFQPKAFFTKLGRRTRNWPVLKFLGLRRLWLKL